MLRKIWLLGNKLGLYVHDDLRKISHKPHDTRKAYWTPVPLKFVANCTRLRLWLSWMPICVSLHTNKLENAFRHRVMLQMTMSHSHVYKLSPRRLVLLWKDHSLPESMLKLAKLGEIAHFHHQRVHCNVPSNIGWQLIFPLEGKWYFGATDNSLGVPPKMGLAPTLIKVAPLSCQLHTYTPINSIYGRVSLVDIVRSCEVFHHRQTEGPFEVTTQNHG